MAEVRAPYGLAADEARVRRRSPRRLSKPPNVVHFGGIGSGTRAGSGRSRDSASSRER